MKKKTLNIPIGAQHISLLEPLNFNFICENEKIIDVEADVGFVHRGVEKSCASKFEFKQVPFVVARVCGLCAITHSLTYTLAAEELLGYESNEKIKYLRMLMVELDRIHSHLLCLSHTAESAGYEALFMETMADREIIMDVQEAISGNRVQFDYITIGGVARDLSEDVVQLAKKNLKLMRAKVEKLQNTFLDNWSLSLKYKGVGILTEDDAYKFNALGPLARASGVRTDVRMESSKLPFEDVGFQIAVGSGGDIHARNSVRFEEIFNSIVMCENILEGIPEGQFQDKVKGKPEGEAIVRLEAPRGELFYYVKGSKKNILDRVRIKTPTFSGVPAMIEVFKNSQYADAPAILASFDPCLSCTAK